MFEKEAEDKAFEKYPLSDRCDRIDLERNLKYEEGFQEGAESTLRKVIKYFSTIVLDENCGGYFSRLLESEEKLQELAKELENV